MHKSTLNPKPHSNRYSLNSLGSDTQSLSHDHGMQFLCPLLLALALDPWTSGKSCIELL